MPSQKERMTSKLSTASLTNGDGKPGGDTSGSPTEEEENPVDSWVKMGLVQSGMETLCEDKCGVFIEARGI